LRFQIDMNDDDTFTDSSPDELFLSTTDIDDTRPLTQRPAARSRWRSEGRSCGIAAGEQRPQVS
jgi:hypothetical protein